MNEVTIENIVSKQMKIIIYAIAILSLASCENSQLTSIGFGYLETIPQSFYGSQNKTLRFILLPTFDYVTDSEIRAGTDGSSKGVGTEWWMKVKPGTGEDWKCRIGQNKAMFGNQEFNLSQGEVFILEEGFKIVQIEGSIAGSVKDEQNEIRLSCLLQNYKKANNPQ